ncbi:MAG: redoxin domain-containing protein, partial [Planctomycetes bacterium]|nr:redoxin domain-containing protein [Planctomycetota bacterium]
MRSLTGALLAAMLVAALDADLASPAAAQEAADGRVSRDLDELRFGVQLVGPRLSRHDLEGRVVVLYHWCITCPISTGAFPYMNRLAEQYADRGVLVIGFQVARNPVLEENNVVWALHHLRPSFPVAMLGTEWEWPAMYLPWVIVFDHEGRRIYGGNL